MGVMGIGLDYSDTFRNHPCPTSNTTEKNYTLCFVTCTLCALAAMAVTTQFRFPQPNQQHRPDEVGGLVMDTRIDEVDPAVAQKTRAKQLQTNAMSEEASWKSALKAMMNVHFAVYLLGLFVSVSVQEMSLPFVLASTRSRGNCCIFLHFRDHQQVRLCEDHVHVFGCKCCQIFAHFLDIESVDDFTPASCQGCVLAVVWATATSYVSLVSPPHLKATSQYILTILYHGLGRGLGPMIGGMIINSTGTRGMFAIMAFLTLLVLGANYGVNRMLKFDGNKYSHNFDDESDMEGTLAPQGIPMSQQNNKITEAFNQTSVMNTNYGAIADQANNPRDDAYDRYVSNPYE
uniref:Major facilitator superfamily associated domain-containing protein n=1 Tax=Ditylenchus dipsaci TaxID=166011 RepID=A0A915EHU7_9BILA